MRRALLAALAALCLAGCAPRAPEPGSPTPAAGNGHNILLITIDTLRADHMGTYGYERTTSPAMDALAAEGTAFEQAYTYWPKTRGSFVVMLTGRYPSGNGYSKHHPRLLDFNPTLASVLRKAGYRTVAIVDNPNVAASLGYAKGFDSYRETWEEPDLETEMDRTRAITQDGIRFLSESAQGEQDTPFLLWLHYVNPHTPYTPPAPYDSAFLDEAAPPGEALPLVPGYHGGIPKRFLAKDRRDLEYYVAQYDGEIAAVDHEVGRLLRALRESGRWDRTVTVVTSDHGESLGEHGYYFDHGEDLFDPCLRVPWIMAVPGAPKGHRSDLLASTLDLVPTLLDAVKVSYPPGLDGVSLLPAVKGRWGVDRERLFSQNDRNLSGTYDRRFKLVATPHETGRSYALFDRSQDVGETRDSFRSLPDRAAEERGVLEQFLGDRDREWEHTGLLTGDRTRVPLTPEACAKLQALNYVVGECEGVGAEESGR